VEFANVNKSLNDPFKNYEEFKRKKDLMYSEIIQQKTKLDSNHKHLIHNK